jgi:hypothetical protein
MKNIKSKMTNKQEHNAVGKAAGNWDKRNDKEKYL